MKKISIFRFNFLIFCIVVTLLFFGFSVYAQETDEDTPSILILNSDSPVGSSEKGLSEGFLKHLYSLGISKNHRVYYEYLYADNFTDQTYITHTAQNIASRYKNININCVVAFGNFAFDFLAKNQREIWGNDIKPVVFAGVTGFEYSMIDSLDNFTGIGHTIKHTMNLNLISAMNEKRDVIQVLVDTSSVKGKMIFRDIEKQTSNSGENKYSALSFILDISRESVLRAAREYHQNNSPIYLSDSDYSANDKIRTQEVLDIFKKERVPVWCPNLQYVGKGSVIGGYATIPEREGKAVADIVNQILSGKSPVRIMPDEPEKVYFFDMKMLAESGISKGKVAELTQGKYIEYNQLETNNQRFLIVLSAICILLLFGVLYIALSNRKRRKDLFNRDWKSLADSIPDVVFAFGPGGKYLFISESARHQLGINPEDIIGKTAKEANLPKHVVESDHEIIIPIFKNKTPVENEYSLEIDGQTRYFETKYSPVANRFGEIIYVLGVIRNITSRKHMELELKESQERFKITMQALNDGMWEWYPVTNDVAFSDRWYTLIGYSPGEIEESFETWTSLMHAKDKEPTLEKLREYADTGAPFSIVFRMKNKKEGYNWMEARGKTVEWLEDAHPKRIVGTITDVSERIAAGEEMKKAKEEAEAADRLKTFFLSNMSHEIRTPMNQIIGFSKLLIRDGLNSEDKLDYSNLINRNAKQLITLIDDIIDISKIESNQIEINKTFFAFNAVLNDLYIMFKSELVNEGKSHIKLICRKAFPDSTAVILNDELRLTQIMTNMLNNAIKFTDEGEIEYGYCTPNKKEILFFVRDTGIGIPASKYETIFELFRQGDGSYTRSYGGTGLGLSISRRLARMMGGDIWVESKESEGSTFYLRLPYDESVVEMFADEEDMPGKEQLKDLDLSEYTIMVVDDTIEVVQYLQILLETTGVDFMFATSGEEAIELYRKHIDKIDLVLMDIQMPDMDGMQVTKKIKEINKDVAVVAQTAFALVAEKELFMQAGCDDFIPKPLEDSRLIDIFKRFLLHESPQEAQDEQ